MGSSWFASDRGRRGDRSPHGRARYSVGGVRQRCLGGRKLRMADRSRGSHPQPRDSARRRLPPNRDRQRRSSGTARPARAQRRAAFRALQPRGADGRPDRLHDREPARPRPHSRGLGDRAGLREPHGLPHQRDRAGGPRRRLALAADQLRLLQQPGGRRGPGSRRRVSPHHTSPWRTCGTCACNPSPPPASPSSSTRPWATAASRLPRSSRSCRAGAPDPDAIPVCLEPPCLPDYDPQLWVQLSIDWLGQHCAQYFPHYFAAARAGP